MGDKPIWEQIGSSFVQHYYQLFDADRTQLGAIYVSMQRRGAGLCPLICLDFPVLMCENTQGGIVSFILTPEC